MINVTVRERPALFSSPMWQETDSEGNQLPATEAWRDQRKKYESKRWKIGLWTNDHNPTEQVLGLMLDGPYPTHLAFYINDLFKNPRALENKDMYFDAGTPCTELVVEANEWMCVLNELGITDRYLSMQNTAKSKTES